MPFSIRLASSCVHCARLAGFLAVVFVAAPGPPPADADVLGVASVLGGSADVDGDGDVDLDDYRSVPNCLRGPVIGPPAGSCALLDFDNDQNVDLRDFRSFQLAFIPPPPAAGNQCPNPIAVLGENVVAFNNLTATRDGPVHAECAFRGQDQINNDVWICWTAPCSELVVVETCGLTTIDSKIAVYQGCSCPATDARLLACNDDFCSVQTRATFQAQATQSYLIRIGSFPGTPGGSGSVRISCGFGPCPGAGDCFTGHPTPGCADNTCCNSICAVDPICCEEEWDDFCSFEAAGLCSGGFEVCGSPLSGSCRVPHLTPGCNDAACCDKICSELPSCCIDQWAEVPGFDCVDLEARRCFGACSTSTQSCFAEHGTPGCNSVACCAEVCPRDSFCCKAEWDTNCVNLANTYCN